MTLLGLCSLIVPVTLSVIMFLCCAVLCRQAYIQISWSWAKPLLSAVRSHLFGVIVEDTDGAQLRPDAAALCEGSAALLVRSFFEFVCNSNISDWRWPGFYMHVSQESRVQQEEADSRDQTDQEGDHQEQKNYIRHGFPKRSGYNHWAFYLYGKKSVALMKRMAI